MLMEGPLACGPGSLSSETLSKYTKTCGWKPYRVNAIDFCQQQCRMHWQSWLFHRRAPISMYERAGYMQVKFRASFQLPVTQWIEKGWRPAGNLAHFHSLACHIAFGARPPVLRSTPPQGGRGFSAYALRQWREDHCRQPPCNYESSQELVHLDTGVRRRKTVTENERSHVLPTDYTYMCMNGKMRKQWPIEWQDWRLKLISGTNHPVFMAVAVGELLLHMVRDACRHRSDHCPACQVESFTLAEWT